ncbi:MAG: fused MFS/spermidine synthase [Verrucomicrobiaceae bacterium]|nr:fused MFS/spermidine synthase [Verrucomicrobiaceae bacterium]
MNLVFCLVSLLGAFLLFQVQPVISKFILPWFGGSPGVWTTCMLFFQVMLFGGYSYAHLLAKRKPRTQAMVHGVVLLAAALCLPIAPDAGLKPSGSVEPVSNILLLLLRTVGIPYFVLAATSPLVQVWFSHQFPKRNPWRLYSLSNIGSLTALLSYPVLIEPRWDVLTQTKVWSVVFGGFALLMGACAFANRVRPEEVTPEGDPHPLAGLHMGNPTWLQRAGWLLLPGFASVMLLATTNHVCQDVAVIPFLWVAPLSLYLASFIICFDHPRWYLRAAWALPTMVLLFLAAGMSEIGSWNPGFVAELLVHLGAMFGVCVICHGELARLKPDPKHLTEYYLVMSAGGALGGLVVSILAPLIFRTFFEWSLALFIGFALATCIALLGLKLSRGARIAGAVAGLVALLPMIKWEMNLGSRIARARDFYGTLSVSEREDVDEHAVYRAFISGSTKHGRQCLAANRRRDPLTYYAHDTGAGIALESLKSTSGAKVGIIGMGAGTLACYAEPGQTYRFYELNPTAVKFALEYFSFVADMEARGAKYELALGDARLTLEHEPPQNFDALVLDAFSGDSVPVHLLTREAFDLYMRHLKPGGIIVVHITNHYLNLAPVVERAAREFQLGTTRIARAPEPDSDCYPTDYLVLTRDDTFLKAHPPVLPPYAKSVDVPLWTDHRHNLFQILRNW